MEVESNHVEGIRNKSTILGNAVRGIRGALKYVIQNGNKVFAPIIKHPTTGETLTQAHHIIPQALKEHELLKKIGFDINDKINIITLPTKRGKEYFTAIGANIKRSVHQGKGLHEDLIDEMRNEMTDILEGGIENGYTSEQYKEKVKLLINKETLNLKNGTRRLVKNEGIVAKVTRFVATSIVVVSSLFNPKPTAAKQPVDAGYYKQIKAFVTPRFKGTNTAHKSSTFNPLKFSPRYSHNKSNSNQTRATQVSKNLVSNTTTQRLRDIQQRQQQLREAQKQALQDMHQRRALISKASQEVHQNQNAKDFRPQQHKPNQQITTQSTISNSQQKQRTLLQSSQHSKSPIQKPNTPAIQKQKAVNIQQPRQQNQPRQQQQQQNQQRQQQQSRQQQQQNQQRQQQQFRQQQQQNQQRQQQQSRQQLQQQQRQEQQRQEQQRQEQQRQQQRQEQQRREQQRQEQQRQEQRRQQQRQEQQRQEQRRQQQRQEQQRREEQRREQQRQEQQRQQQQALLQKQQELRQQQEQINRRQREMAYQQTIRNRRQ